MTTEDIINTMSFKCLFLPEPELWILIDMTKNLLQFTEGSEEFQQFLGKV